MDFYLVWTTLFLLLVHVPVSYSRAVHKINERPIIGLVLKATQKSKSQFGDEYVAATYVKFLESAGARVVPIRGNQPLEYYDRLFNSINGVMLPGGAASLSDSSYARTGRIMYNKAIQANQQGDYFPMWGTCLGFELLTVLTAGTDLLQKTNTENITLALHFSQDYKSSRMLQHMPRHLIRQLADHPVTQNNHHYSLLWESFSSSKSLSDFYQLLATSVDREQNMFVSLFEAKDYPIYGSQWHPEKPQFLWHSDSDINHDPSTIQASQYLADFFINEARRSPHRYESMESEIESIIENFVHKYMEDSTFMEYYFFNHTTSFLWNPHRHIDSSVSLQGQHEFVNEMSIV